MKRGLILAALAGLALGVALGPTWGDATSSGIPRGVSARYISGWRISVTGDEAISITSGLGVDRTGNVMLSTSATVTTTTPFAAWTDAGLIGLDTGAQAANTWYYIHAIRASTGADGFLLSTSRTAPSMPAGATLRRWIGAVRNDSGSNLFLGQYVGEGVYRRWDYQENANAVAMWALNGGADIVRTTVAFSTWAPLTARTIVTMAKTDAAVDIYLIHAADATNGLTVFTPASTSETITATVLLDGSQQAGYSNGAGGGNTDWIVRGYEIAVDGSE